MRFVDVWIESTAPLLQHRFHDHDAPFASPRDAAERAAYRDVHGAMAMPGAAFAQVIRRAAPLRFEESPLLPRGLVFVLDDLVPLFRRDRQARVYDFEVDTRSVVCGGTRRLRYRARIDEWSARLRLRVDDDRVRLACVRALLELGGAELGVGDFRVERGGPFGTFAIVDWREREPSAAAMREVA